MKLRSLTNSSIASAMLLAGFCMVPTVQAVGQSGSAVDWTYRSWGDNSDISPSRWGEEYPLCYGSRQSPIDIPTYETWGNARKPAPLSLAGECSNYHLEQVHGAFMASPLESTCNVSTREKTYSFLQLHYHTPSEHTIDGNHRDGEIHFVHKADDGMLLVIGLFLRMRESAETDPFIARFWEALDEVDPHSAVEVALGPFFALLQDHMERGHVFNYPGSLTTPKCDEIVDWWVINRSVYVSEKEFYTFSDAMRRLEAGDYGYTARPTQPLNGRSITVY